MTTIPLDDLLDVMAELEEVEVCYLLADKGLEAKYVVCDIDKTKDKKLCLRSRLDGQVYDPDEWSVCRLTTDHLRPARILLDLKKIA